MFKLLFSYYSHAPPKFEDLKRVVEATLKPILGEISVSEGSHYSLSMVSWVLPVLVSTSAKTTPEAISEALPRISGVGLIDVVELGDSESPVLGLEREAQPSAGPLPPPGDMGAI